LSVVTVVVLVFYNRSSHFAGVLRSDTVGNVTRSVFKSVKEELDGLLDKQSQDLIAGKQAGQQAANTALEPCPDDPPDLIGPFSVEFGHTRTWNEVRKKISSPLQDGGRHKPTNCVSKHKVAIIIPYRNRHEHLKHLLFYLHPMLVRQQLDYGIYVINQDGEGVFNRAKLMNVGFAEAAKEYDYECFIFSDVDLVPMDDRNLYRCFEGPPTLVRRYRQVRFQAALQHHLWRSIFLFQATVFNR
uniref:Galactosyltransferase N-terminal domain-containing protein n=1 Tax=Tetraodon nigroviridis TaxID=99883 RepID=H3CFD4_TETNG